MIQEFFPVLDAVPMGDLWILLIWGLLIMAVWMLALWLWHIKLQNVSVVDFGWSGGLALLGVFYALKGDGYAPRRFLIGTMVFIWGAKRAWQVLSGRILGGQEEDPQNPLGVKRFLFFQWQAIFAVLLSVPFALLAVDPLPKISGYEWLGLFIWLVALIGESIADSERKPLFEWLIWVGYFVAALTTDYGAWTIFCPLMMFVRYRRRG